MAKVNFCTIVLSSDGSWKIYNFDLTANRALTDEEVVTAVRGRVVADLSRFPGVPPLQIPEAPDVAISSGVERDAEMETYLLINRCQGNG